MENQEIKEANRKAMPMFILLVIAGAAAGGIMGFVIAKYGLHGFSENIERVADVFSTFVAPWMMFTYNSGFCSVNIKPLLYEN